MKKETRKIVGMVVSVCMTAATGAKCIIDAIKLKSEIDKTKAETEAIKAGIDREKNDNVVSVDVIESEKEEN